MIRLADGRRMGWAEYGDPGGVAVVSCHGGLLCRTDAAPAEAVARGLGVRLISPDRPGIGLSDAAPGRTTAGWAADVTQLADRLGLGRFAVTGWSYGGQYAAAVAWALPDRVTRAAIVAGCLPLDEPGRLAELNPVDRAILRLGRRSPALARAGLGGLGVAARLGRSARARSAAEALRRPSGVVEDYLAAARPWGFRLEDVAAHIDVWQGTADRLVPAPWATEIARRAPVSTLVMLEGEGHLIGLTRRGEVLERLVA